MTGSGGKLTITEPIDGNYICQKVNGVKYYYVHNVDGQAPVWVSILNDKVYKSTSTTYSTTENTSAIDYYKNASEFTKWVRDELGNLRTTDAVDENGNHTLNDVFGNELVFDKQGDINIEDPNSLFNQQRLAVIRYSIEKNLSIAIANYNNYTGITTNFQMPELKEDEWEQILNNVSVISFMQGLSIGGKIYNGYSIVTNTKTEEVINTDAIYITTSDVQYHRPTDTDLKNLSNLSITGAYYNIDFERKSAASGTNEVYYYPHNELGCYSSIVTQTRSFLPR